VRVIVNPQDDARQMPDRNPDWDKPHASLTQDTHVDPTSNAGQCRNISVQTTTAEVEAMVTGQQQEDRAKARTTNVRINTVVDWQKTELKVMLTSAPGPVCTAKADANDEKEELTKVKDDDLQITNCTNYKLNCSGAATLGTAAVRTDAPESPVQHSCCGGGDSPRSPAGVKIPGLLLGRPPDSSSHLLFHTVFGHGCCHAGHTATTCGRLPLRYAIAPPIGSDRLIMYLCGRNDAPRSTDRVQIPGLLLGRPPDSSSRFLFRRC